MTSTSEEKFLKRTFCTESTFEAKELTQYFEMKENQILPDESFSGLRKSARIVFKNKQPDPLYVSFKIAAPIELTDVKIKYFSVGCRHF